ncbi:MAG: N-acyl homoserine lactonase family protein [Candidatus Tectomicrobia bacterium]|uniref:N-acyl homoserine lactonase family protein n=1 Tax=Tectimicrobiota bacterium TaxID=2528274 RepID=A0A938B2F7_UNCTE|nr:N-acyl homoserine lactonase family protein [Candidatus Tectomicrobia bacterium]
MLQIYALCVGYLELDRASMLSDLPSGTPWTVPVSSYLVVHPQGRLLFDTGVHGQTLTDPVGRMGAERARRIRIRSQVGDDVVSQLSRAGLQPGEITHVVNSHLHFDHCGGNEFFPQATFLVQQAEMDAARQPGGVPSYSPSVLDFDHPLNYQLVDGEHDVFGDGKVLLIPTYGHTPGHQSLLVRAGKDTQMVFTADACYTRENLDRDVLPRVLWHAETMAQSLATLRHLRDRQGATMFYGHDPEQWQGMRRVPAALVEA